MKNYKYEQNTTKKFSIKGELSENGKVITYVDQDKDEKTITVDKCFSKFAGLPIEVAIAVKSVEDLGDELEGNNSK